jgi:eukaryotic-like serine/threonine-protein kinase
VSDKPAQSIHPGDILAEKYRVERILGQGGMGVVVLAEHIDLRERVAIKFLLDAPAVNPELSERFLREARAAVKIKSEHVVRVIDVGRLPTGAPYMVMEYLEGEDLSQRLASGPVPIQDAVDYVIQGCEAMGVAHRLGIVHRDLKPANLFLTQRPDGSSLVKVLDFGISKVKTQDSAQLSLTHTQAMMGSPLYMSPEQMRSSKDVSPSADIWSLGVILHELIAGDVPFDGVTFPEVLVKVMGEPPPRLRSVRAEVPEGLEAVVLRCLEKNPADRYSSVAALGVALSPYASARTVGLQARLRSSVSRAPVPAATTAALFRGAEVAPVPAAVAPTNLGLAADVARTAAAPAVERSPSKTNTAWSEPAGARAARSGGSRRVWVFGAGTIGLVALLALALVRSPDSTIPNAATSASPSAEAPVTANAASAAGSPSVARAPAAADAPSMVSPGTPGVMDGAAGAVGEAASASAQPREPQIRPAPSSEGEGGAAADPLSRVPASPSNTGQPEPSLVPVSQPDEHTLAAPPTESEGATVAKASAPAPRTAAKTRPRARTSAPLPAKPATPAPAPSSSAPPPKTRTKPLSIEFK